MSLYKPIRFWNIKSYFNIFMQRWDFWPGQLSVQLTRHIVIWHLVIWHIVIWHIVIWHIVIWHIVIWHIVIWHIVIWHIVTWHIVTWHIVIGHIIIWRIVIALKLPMGWQANHWDSSRWPLEPGWHPRSRVEVSPGHRFPRGDEWILCLGYLGGYLGSFGCYFLLPRGSINSRYVLQLLLRDKSQKW